MAVKFTDVSDFLGVTNTRANEPVLPSKPSFDPEKEGERKVLYEWDTVTRIQPKIMVASKVNRSLLIIAALVALLLVSMKEFLLIAVVSSIVFVRYILSATPGESVHHKITNHGVDFAGQFYSWADLKHYFFISHENHEMLCIDTHNKLPGRLFMIIQTSEKEKIKEIVGKYLTFLQEPPSSVVDKMFETAFSKIKVDK